jgi:prevent-host-death family protein
MRLWPLRLRANLVSMTRKAPAVTPVHAPPTVPERASPAARPALNRWRLQDAKARFSELVRLAHSEGPQHVTLHGREVVVVMDAQAFERLQGQRTGELLVQALQASPHRSADIAPPRGAMPVRAVTL